jgi:2-polyprenyl-6-methoxyphenol hydroxylase-like FAD-dependent oxidoreductase
MEIKMKPQVLIVGAGPVGLTMAAELARYGVAVRIVDKAAARTDKSKALVLWSRTLELLDRAGCSGAFVAAGQKMVAANIIAGNKLIGHISIATVNSPYPYALMLPQSETERLLEEHLNRQAVTVERQVEVTSFASSESSVTSVLRKAGGQEETLTTEWLIGCDGAHSMVRHGLGLSFEGDTLPSDWALADIHLKGYPFGETELATYWHEQGVLVFFPISPGRFRVIADIGLSAGLHPADPTLDQIQDIIDQRGPGGVVASDPIWLSAFRINERKVGNYRSGRVFVAGDAAHVHSPAGGQGMNTGMQDAFNLSWKLALVCRNTCSGRLLDSYSVERSAIGDEVLKAAGHLTAVAVLRNHAAQTVRNLIGRVVLGLAPFRSAMVDTMTEVSIVYKHSPLNGASARGIAGPAPGERVAPVAGQAPVGSGDAPRFALFGKTSDATAELLGKFGDLLDPDIRPPLGPDGMWLVRPDGYTACVAGNESIQIIFDYLNNAVQKTAQVASSQ